MKLPRWLLAVLVGLAMVPAGAHAQQGTITGLVVDRSTMQPLADVQVVVVGTTRGALTGPDGRYRLAGIEPGIHTVRATRIGFDGQSRQVTVGAAAPVVANFELATAAISLDAIVVTATGEQKKRELANAVANVNADQIVDRAPITNVAELLNGRASGVAVLQSSGTTGTGSRIRIRGSNSISLSNEPVIFVDGIRISSGAQDFSLGLGGQEPSALDNLNPEEIESIEVIKGPSAATLYGTDAANGVIRITTKRGTAGSPRWNFWVEQGILDDYVDYPANFEDTNYCATYLAALGECETGELMVFSPLETERTDPFRTGYRQQYGMSVSGGAEAVRYYLSGEFEGENGVLGLSDEDRQIALERYGELSDALENPNRLSKVHLRANVSATPLENLSVNVSTGFITSDLRLPQADNNFYALIGNALLGSADPESAQPYIPYGPVEVFAIDSQQEIRRFIGSVGANYQPASWLTARATLGLDVNNRFEHQFIPIDAITLDPPGFRAANRLQVETFTGDVGATAQFDLNQALNSRTSVGVQFFRDLFRATYASGESLVPGTGSLGGAAITESSEATSEAVTLGTFVEQQFGWNDRLFITGALRADDNSAFGEDFDLIVYPKLGASYVLIDDQGEPFWNVVNSVRLRTAYGTSGVAPGATAAVQFFNAVTARVDDRDVPGVSFADVGAVSAGIGNVDLKPERSTELEVGADIGLLDGRLGLEVTYYNKETRDALVQRPLAPSLGVPLSRWENLGSVRNTGIEATVNAVLVDRSAFNWNLGITGSLNENELLELGEGIEPILLGAQRHTPGYPLGSFFDNPWEFDDLDGNGIITPDEITVGEEAVFLGSPFPEQEFAFNTDLTLWNLVQIRGLLEYRGNFSIENTTEQFRCYYVCRGLFDPDASLFDQARAVATWEDIGTDAPYVEDASFWKLREVGATILVPERWANRLGSDNLSIAFTGRNLGTWTDYTGIDPELNSSGASSSFGRSDFLTQAPVRTFTVRLNASF